MSRRHTHEMEGASSRRENRKVRPLEENRAAPFLHELPKTVRALHALARGSKARRSDPIALGPASGKEYNLSGFALNRLLHSYGITVRRSVFAGTPDESVAIADGIGFPVALKIISPQVAHGSGIAEKLADSNALRSTAEAMTSALRSRHGEPIVDGYFVQEVATGVELIVGVGADAKLGPFMVAGIGSAASEAVDDLTVGLLPVAEDDARNMLESLSGTSLGAAAEKSPDVTAAAQAMEGLSRFFLDHRQWLTGVELSPLIVLGEGDGVRVGNVRIAGLHDSRKRAFV
ncbi:MAG: acetate--CoA ligase family protein [Betaproteobacteria bacterium]|nr:acetate--CoA ligase family protein [Betaproteobacteria bacterium]